MASNCYYFLNHYYFHYRCYCYCYYHYCHHYYYVVIILFITDLCKSGSVTCSFENLVFSSFFYSLFLSVLFWTRCHLINTSVTKCSVILFSLYKNYLSKQKKIVLEKTCLQRGIEFFKNISFIKKKVEHQKLKVVQKI